MAETAAGRAGWLAGWWRRRRAERARLAYEVWNLSERYGPAAYLIARNSARQPGAAHRRFWRRAAARLRRGRADERYAGA